jgi:transposase
LLRGKWNNGGRCVKASRWLLLRNRDNIDREEDRVRLDELLAANRKRMRCTC